ncbi:hypothetical protein NFI96_013427 [Prochilodus magdalenae]|nr:hypothetical protein NFI96_013427 [Prochilodus magdalenae]
MSQIDNSKPRRPARPQALHLFMVQPSRPAPPPPTARTAPKTPTSSLEGPVTPAYIDVVAKDVPPLRPAPPVPRRPVLSRGQCFSQSTESSNEYEQPSDVQSSGNSWHSVNADATEDIPLYESVLPSGPELKNFTTPQTPLPAPRRPPAPPRPYVPSRPAMEKSRRPFLSESISEEPAEHLYEYISDVLPDTLPEEQGVNGEQGVSAAARKPLTPHPLRSLSEHSSVDGDSSAKELDILLVWWSSVEGWEELQSDHQGVESETNRLTLVAHRMKMGMRLYQLLVFRRGRILLNHITELHCTADSLSRVGKNTRIAGITGGTTGAVGAAAVVAGIALAPLTFGASLVATGIGVGVAAAGGVTGASAAITNKVKSNQVRSKVEKILRNYRIHMEDIIECLEFIDVGMKHLRKCGPSEAKRLDTCTSKIVKMAQEMDSFCSSVVISECSCMLQGFASGLDSYFSEEDKLKLKKGSEKQFAENIREVANKLKESMDELIRIKNLFRSVLDLV